MTIYRPSFVPPWDCPEAARSEAADELASMSIRDLFQIALGTATALKGVPGIEGSTRELFDRCADAMLDVYTAPKNSDLGPRDFAKARQEIWEGAHPRPPEPTFAEFVAKMKVPAGIVKVV